ncbi:MAG: S8 family serine peptidase, partial [Bacteroidota bacterium]|nr:S8 family serine peptidase [Bacteroidota bacterium]
MKAIRFTITFLFLSLFISNIGYCGNLTSGNQIKNHEYRPYTKLKSDEYLKNTIIFKIKPQYRNLCKAVGIEDEKLKTIFIKLGVKSLGKIYPNHTPPLQNKSFNSSLQVDLSLIYELEYANSFDIEEAINLLYKSELIDYAEPHYIQKTLLTPNDPNISSQYHLNLIHAYEAWDICTGDTNVVIGIVDTGTDFGHPDLGNIKYNYNDPIDGKDNDGDGYIDNFYGWDLGENKNNPQWDANESHGVLVTGSASATTNNGIGIAGVGFKCKYLPIKVSNSAGALTKTYEGIVYAADHRCQIINCSWGDSASGYSQYHQDIINYATYNKNSLIVASAGNASNQSIYYPAAYENVISVAGSDQSDVK